MEMDKWDPERKKRYKKECNELKKLLETMPESVFYKGKKKEP